MDVKKAISDRRSIRAFTSTPVTQDVLRNVLNLASRAISRVNIHPWEFAVVTGEILDKIKSENIACFQKGVPESIPLNGVYRERQVDIAKRLFSSMGIARDDKERRTWWTQRGYRYFDAPAAIIIYTGENTDRIGTYLDIGCVTQNICIAAMEFGLGTCVANQGVTYPEVLYKNLNIPKEKEIVVSIAIGYPDWDFPANHVISPRTDIDTLTSWYGF